MSNIKELILAKYNPGDTFEIEAKAGQTFALEFTIIEKGENPLCNVVAKDRTGKVVAVSEMLLEGTGRWVTSKEWPLLVGDPLFGKPDKNTGFLIAYGMVYPGGQLVVSRPENPRQRLTLDLFVQKVVSTS